MIAFGSHPSQPMWKRQNLAGLSIVRQASMLARQTATSMPDRKPDEVEEEMLRHQLRMAIEEYGSAKEASNLAARRAPGLRLLRQRFRGQAQSSFQPTFEIHRARSGIVPTRRHHSRLPAIRSARECRQPHDRPSNAPSQAWCRGAAALILETERKLKLQVGMLFQDATPRSPVVRGWSRRDDPRGLSYRSSGFRQGSRSLRSAPRV